MATLITSRPVGEADLERGLAAVRAAAAGPLEGVFGPASVTWRVDREAAVFLGAGRALLLQLAHPWVAAGIAQHSRTLADPIGRFHRTFDVMFSMVFGTLDQALGVARRLHRRHAAVRGAMPSAVGPFAAGSAYAANDAAALAWVQATLVDTALLIHDRLSPAGPLGPAERERYWAESRLFAGLFGVPAADLPPDWAGFAAYRDAVMASDALTVGPEARAIADALLRRGRWPLRMPGWYEAVTAGLLPERLRAGFGLAGGEAEHRRAWARAARLARAAPGRLRLVGPYQEAAARLEGRRPGPSVRLLNRAWIGRPGLAP